MVINGEMEKLALLGENTMLTVSLGLLLLTQPVHSVSGRRLCAQILTCLIDNPPFFKFPEINPNSYLVL